MKIRPVGAELFHADGRTDRQADRHDSQRNFANVPKADISVPNAHDHVIVRSTLLC